MNSLEDVVWGGSLAQTGAGWEGRTASHACPPRRLGARPSQGIAIRSSSIRVVYWISPDLS